MSQTAANSITTESTQSESAIPASLDAQNGTITEQSDIDAQPAPKRGGAPFGNKNNRKHGLAIIHKKRGRALPVDERTRSGRIEKQVRNALIKAYGGAEKLGPRKLILIQLASYDASRFDEHKRARSNYFKRIKIAAAKRGQQFDPLKNPKLLADVDRYIQPCIGSLRANLEALGPEPDGVSTIETLIDDAIREQNGERTEEQTEGGE